MAQQVETAFGLRLAVPESREELLQVIRRPGGMPYLDGGFEECALGLCDLGPEGTALNISSDEECMGVFPGNMQTGDYCQALFAGYGYAADDPRVKQGLEMRLGRGQLLRKTSAAIVSIFNRQALQTNGSIGREVLGGQLRSILEITEDPRVTVHLAPPEIFQKLGLMEMSLIYPNGAPSDDNPEAYGFIDVVDLPTISVPSTMAPILKQEKWDKVFDQALSAKGSRLMIKQALETL